MKSFPNKKKLKDSSSPNQYYRKCEKTSFKKKKNKIKTMNNKMAINTSQN